jgi:chromosome segregation ATPase
MALSSNLVAVLAFVACATVGAEHREASTAGANPIRKVVTMLQSMQKKVTAEGEKEQELFDKFMCYCKNGDEALATSIADAERKAPALAADIEAAETQVKQLKLDLKAHQTDRAAAKTAMAEATTIREKEAATFADLKAEADANIAAVNKATAAIEKGMAGSFFADRCCTGAEETCAFREPHG